MTFYVYMLLNNKGNKNTTYVGYTKNLLNRLKLHNSSKGAKFTRGRKWLLIYHKKYQLKSIAMKEEYKLKKDYKLRSKIKKKYLKNENLNTFTL